MKRYPDHDTREHLLATGAQLCLSLGFVGMGLNKLLTTAKVPKGSFYHYFQSKEAFGVAMLERHYVLYNEQLQQHFSQENISYRELIINWYQQNLDHVCQNNQLPNCLVVKLSAEVCDLSEDMRHALNEGSSQVMTHLANALEKGRAKKCFDFSGNANYQAHIMYSLWLGASLQTKISHSVSPLEYALDYVTKVLVEPDI